MPTSSAIALIGYRGTGKTTVANLLAQQLDFDWIDADTWIGCPLIGIGSVS